MLKNSRFSIYLFCCFLVLSGSYAIQRLIIGGYIKLPSSVQAPSPEYSALTLFIAMIALSIAVTHSLARHAFYGRALKTKDLVDGKYYIRVFSEKDHCFLVYGVVEHSPASVPRLVVDSKGYFPEGLPKERTFRVTVRTEKTKIYWPDGTRVPESRIIKSDLTDPNWAGLSGFARIADL